MKLIIVGSYHTLHRSNRFQSFLKLLQDKQWVYSLPPLSATATATSNVSHVEGNTTTVNDENEQDTISTTAASRTTNIIINEGVSDDGVLHDSKKQTKKKPTVPISKFSPILKAVADNL